MPTPTRSTAVAPQSLTGEGVRLFLPTGFEPRYAYPVVVWCHDAACDETELDRWFPLISDRNYIALASRGPVWLPTGGWTWDFSPRGIDQADRGIWNLIADLAEDVLIRLDRLFLVGCGAGADLALRLAAHSPDCAAGVVALGGTETTAVAIPRGGDDCARVLCLPEPGSVSAHTAAARKINEWIMGIVTARA